MAEYAYRVIYDPIEEGGYQVRVPTLPEIVSYGRTLEEAREMARDAILCTVQSILKDGEEIPEDRFLQEPLICEEIRISF